MFASVSLGLALLPFVVGKVWDVEVGGANGLLEFKPEAFSAAVGDQVVFHFNPKNHSVVQSAFDNPCGPKEGGFNSGFMAVPANTTEDQRPTFAITVEDDKPVWVYCAQAARTPASHCGAGMVFSVNCPFGDVPNSFANFKKSALAIGDKLKADAAAASAGGDGGYGGGYGGAATETYTAPYGDETGGMVTVPAPPAKTVVTVPVTLDGTSTWTTVYTSYADSPAPTPVSPDGAVHTVVVGGPGKLLFTPDHIDAAPRDTIQFIFQQKNHTVTQSSFADPCRKLNAADATLPQGLDSGFMPVADGVTDGFPSWNVKVNSTEPLWFYCRQKTPSSHCGAKMVFAVNAIESSARNFTAFQSLAEKLNGTKTAGATVDPNTSGTPDDTTKDGGALSLGLGGAGLFVTAVAIAASFL